MTKISALTLALAVAGLSSNAFAAEGAGMFLRAEAGVSEGTVRSANKSHESETDSTYGVRGGYFFTKSFAVEAFYTNYYDKSEGGVDTKATGYGVGIVGKSYLTDSRDTGFYIDGRIGLARTKLEGALDGLGSTDLTKTRAYIGGGAGYDFNRNMGVSLNYVYHDSIDLPAPLNNEVRFETLTAAFEYRF